MSSRLCLILVLLLSWQSCAKKVIQDDPPNQEVMKMVKDMMGDKAKVIPNEKGNYILCIAEEVDQSMSYMVIDSKGHVLLPRSKMRGQGLLAQ